MATVDEIMRRARVAAAEFRKLNQERTDAVTRAVYLAAMDHRVHLAKLATDETGLGRWQDKVVKNAMASLLVYEHIRSQRTVGVISENDYSGIIELANPLGPILALVPMINPSSTTIFKSLITMKTRNPVVFSSTAGCKHSVAETARICYDAALNAGAPEHCMQWLEKPNLMKTKEIMNHSGLALILATGTNDLVKISYSSGTPTIGVSAGNVPVYVGATADVPFAVRSILYSKTFDNGSVCASEQAIVVKKEVAQSVIEEFMRQGAYFLSGEEIEKVGAVAYDRQRGMMTSRIVGQSVQRIAEMAGISVPDETSVLIAVLDSVSHENPLSAEILAPILAFYIEEDFEAAISRCTEVARFGGIGHTAAIYSNNAERIEYFSRTLDVARILVNTPTTHGALGGSFNSLPPSFTLSCGSGGKNGTTDNISTRHLLNIHRICRRRLNQRWNDFEQGTLLDESLSSEEIEQAYNRNT